MSIRNSRKNYGGLGLRIFTMDLSTTDDDRLERLLHRCRKLEPNETSPKQQPRIAVHLHVYPCSWSRRKGLNTRLCTLITTLNIHFARDYIHFRSFVNVTKHSDQRFLARLLPLQNTTARLVTGVSKYKRITPLVARFLSHYA